MKYLHNKDSWGEGPWRLEYDFALWIDEVTLYPCIMRRNQYGAWCGFVGLNERHPWYLIEVDNKCWDYIDVHGSVGMASFDKKFDLEFVPPHRKWWVGFNCSGRYDFSPKIKPDDDTNSKKYRDADYVKSEVEEMARQLCVIEKEGINE